MSLYTRHWQEPVIFYVCYANCMLEICPRVQCQRKNKQDTMGEEDPHQTMDNLFVQHSKSSGRFRLKSTLMEIEKSLKQFCDEESRQRYLGYNKAFFHYAKETASVLTKMLFMLCHT